jgi:hypothetical protein
MVCDESKIICPECKKENKDYCYCFKCDKCWASNLECYDDGEGYIPNILCKDCDHWIQ